MNLPSYAIPCFTQDDLNNSLQGEVTKFEASLQDADGVIQKKAYKVLSVMLKVLILLVQLMPAFH